MKNILFFNFLILLPLLNYAQKCGTAFLPANYAVSNTNKAYEGNNTAHIKEWTEKAMEAFSEVEEITSECGCITVSDLAYEGFEACDKAQVENSYERARFYAKRSREKAKLMMDALSQCTNIPISDIEARRLAGNDDYDVDSSYKQKNESANLNAQQKDLLTKQKQLLDQQRLLQKQIADQQKQVNKIKKRRANELLEQKRIKLNAEIAISEIQKNYEKLATSIGCTDALKATKISFAKKTGALENESLSATKLYYAEKLTEIVDKFNRSFSQCSANW